jgi:maltokinase
MREAPPRPNPSLQGLVHRTGWLPFDSDLHIIDGAWIASLPEPLWVGLAHVSGPQPQIFFLALAWREETWQDVSASPLYQLDFLRLLAEQGGLPLTQGAIVFEASRQLPWRDLNLRVPDVGGSSNCVSQIALGEVKGVHKVFRRLTVTDHEVPVCKLLQTSSASTIPPHLGAYRYWNGEGTSLVLGVLNEFFDGHGLHMDLSVNLRALWREPISKAVDGTEAHLQTLLPELLQWRNFLHCFHLHLDQVVGLRSGSDAPIFNMAHYAARVQERLVRLAPLVRTDPLLLPQHASHLADLLTSVSQGLFQQETLHDPTLKASACHGDLHLSHLLWRHDSGGVERRLIDLSPLASRVEQEEFKCSHRLMDWVALARALDYFYLDEVTLELKHRTGVSSAAAMQHMVLAQLDPTQSELVPGWQAALATIAPLGRNWRQLVQHALYGEPKHSRVWQQFYFGRLLQELDYNYYRRRPHFRFIDFHSLLTAFHRPGEA